MTKRKMPNVATVHKFDTVLSNLLHDLRTPINAIIGFSEFLIEEALEDAQGQVVPDFEKILHSALQMHTGINDLLDDNHLEIYRQKDEIDFEQLDREIRFSLRTPLDTIIGFSELLLDELQDWREGEVTEDIEKILSSATKILGQIGQIIEYFKYMIDHPESSKENMTKIEEISKTASKTTSKAISQDPNAIPITGKVLVVDDFDLNRDLISRRLKNAGFQVQECEDGFSALEVLKNESFDVVLLDVVMPKLNGYDTLLKFKEGGLNDAVPVIMLSAFDNIEIANECIKDGAEDYVLKPINFVKLLARVKSSIKKKQLCDQNG